jgi:hypothetical protein
LQADRPFKRIYETVWRKQDNLQRNGIIRTYSGYKESQLVIKEKKYKLIIRIKDD